MFLEVLSRDHFLFSCSEIALHYLILDTCVWVDLAVFEVNLIAKLAKLVDDGKATVVLPELIRSEWDGCKRKIVDQITNQVVESRRSALQFQSFVAEGDSNTVPDQISSVDPKALGAKIAAKRIVAIERILDSDETIGVSVSSNSRSLAIHHALEKKAPFRMRNSMADALIFFSAVEWANAMPEDRSVFVTHNTKDFSDEKRGEDDNAFKDRIAPELQSLIENNGLKYFVVVGRVLNEIEQFVATEDEIAREEAVVERTHTMDELLEEIISCDGIAQQEMKEMLSGSAVTKMLEEQQKIKEMLSGSAVTKMLEEQQKIKEMLSGSAVTKMLEEQQKIKEMLSGSAVTKKLEEQLKRKDQDIDKDGNAVHE
ncbi:PIN domain-containing protein [Thalassoglobus sp. JC818]|uniref:PIN domain-containing protein n=1 Tax=Thalassoglobus sp. JC818 TaxID=3232136 RepID=UPI0034583EC4